jgi:putative aminopeptidase FrvX
MNARDRRLLARLLSQPTAPFREARVREFVRSTLDRSRVPHFSDPAGNLVIGCASPAAYRALLRGPAHEPVRLFIAHMDHPGFHGLKWLSPGQLQVKWHGGSPVKHLRMSRVWLADDSGYVGTGKFIRARLLPSRHAIDTAVVKLDKPLEKSLPAASLYGAFRFRSPVWQSGQRLYTKAADDLVGVFAVVTTALALFSRPRRKHPPFIGLLTRGEEVGFVGALAHFELGWLERAHRPVIAVSLETSRTLPNARIGKGPVVRLGDRRTIFDPDYLHILCQVAETILPKRHQRRIMDGGTCEATAALAWGLRAIGISVPLGNYHNQGLEGGPDCVGENGPAPEFVHLEDIDGLLALCRGLMEPGLPWSDPWKLQRERLRKNLHSYQRLLKAPRRVASQY